MVGSEICELQVDDIEDIGKNGDLEAIERLKINAVLPKSKKRNDDGCRDDVEVQSFVPGMHKVYVKTWGCAHNNSDGEYMAGLLSENGYKIVSDKNDAHIWLLNSCTVKNPAEDHFRNAVESGLGSGKHVIVAGCVPQAAPKASYIKDISVIGVQQIDRVVEVVEETLKGNKVRLMGKKKEGKRKLGGASLHLPKIRRNPLIEIIAINTGCLNQCTYCKTKHARGELGSYPVKDIVDRAREVFQEGVKEIWLTSEDTGAYGRDIGTSLPELMYALIKVIPDDCRLRLGMTNPPYILEHLEDMAHILSHPKIYSFLHIPVQSGSDSVLGDMKREYCVEEFQRIVDFLKQRVDGITIATDIICGFPTETESDFQETMKLVERNKFPSLFINQFYPRPGTPAFKMTRVPTNEVKQRTRRLTELFESYKPYEDRVGKLYSVLVTEESHDKQHYVGHNIFYEQILVPKDSNLLGKMIDVQITSVGKHYMVGCPQKQSLFNYFKSFPINLSTVWLSTCCVIIVASVAIKVRSKF
ncbi:threonylcarbamoyladenosine tRNA methylthiotransferase-like protein [Leptotrombidium deliense]|uniref:tRNA-t(6)A37 methylthiotransferase n=1 Tax=Leptotrombidium deliense TaxID=299467 RepID=A0A443SGB8_9ACAR|nr:threonylcarbamoyladenosine tRNA methylthiotransferase-like protein [Leptotrombidium deliense]